MASLPVCPSCGAMGVGERCARCGIEMKPAQQMMSVAVPGLQLEGADAAPAAKREASRPERKAAAYLRLQPSETAVLQAASQIFAGFAASGVVTQDNEKELADRAVQLATRMALVIERYVQSDDEDW